MSMERTERATPRRRQEARRQGQVPNSPDLSAAVGLLFAVLFLRWYGAHAVAVVARQMQATFSGLNGRQELTPLLLKEMSWNAGVTFFQVTAPLLGIILLAAAASTLVQTGFVMSPASLKPDFKRINPWLGLRRILSKRGAFDTGKAIAKLVIIGAMTYPVLKRDVERFAGLTGSDPMMIGRSIGSAIGELALRVSLAYLIISLLDYAFQRWDLEQRLKMSRQETRDELRQTEGNPEIKGRIRQIQRQMARRRMMASVPKATVVVANPTHLAIALRFDLSSMPAPIVVAKGSGQLAERIKEIARNHSVPVVENRPLARALYQTAEVGSEIPVALFEAVADVIAYVYRLRRRAGLSFGV